MTTPISATNVHTDAALTNFASAYRNSEYIADEASPVLLTDKLSNLFYKRSREDVSAIIEDKISPRGALNQINYSITTATYSCVQRGLDGPVSRTVQANADNPPIDPREQAVANVLDQMMRNRENRVATLVMTSGNWAAANTAAAAAVWSDEVNADPVYDIQTGLEAIPFNGAEVEVIGACSDLVFHTLQRHPKIKELRGGGSSKDGLLPAEEIGRALGLAGIYYSKIQKNTAKQGLTASYSRIWGTNTFALIVRPKALQSTDQMAFSITWRCAEGIEGAVNGIGTREWHVPGEGFQGTDHVAVELQDDEDIIQNDAGFLLTSVR